MFTFLQRTLRLKYPVSLKLLYPKKHELNLSSTEKEFKVEDQKRKNQESVLLREQRLEVTKAKNAKADIDAQIKILALQGTAAIQTRENAEMSAKLSKVRQLQEIEIEKQNIGNLIGIFRILERNVFGVFGIWNLSKFFMENFLAFPEHRAGLKDYTKNVLHVILPAHFGTIECHNNSI